MISLRDTRTIRSSRSLATYLQLKSKGNCHPQAPNAGRSRRTNPCRCKFNPILRKVVLTYICAGKFVVGVIIYIQCRALPVSSPTYTTAPKVSRLRVDGSCQKDESQIQFSASFWRNNFCSGKKTAVGLTLLFDHTDQPKSELDSQ